LRRAGSHGKVPQPNPNLFSLQKHINSDWIRVWYRIGLLFTHKNGDFGAISAAERSCAAPISKVERHISDRFCATLWCRVIGQPRGGWLVMNCKGPWEGYIIIELERDVWVRGRWSGIWTVAEVNGELKKPRRQRPLKSEFALVPALSPLFHFMHFA